MYPPDHAEKRVHFQALACLGPEQEHILWETENHCQCPPLTGPAPSPLLYPGLPLAMPLPSWSKWVSAPPGPGTEQTSLALRKVLHLFTSTRWPPASFCEAGGLSQPWAPEDRPLLLLLHPHPLGERQGHGLHTLTSVSLLLRVGADWGRGVWQGPEPHSPFTALTTQTRPTRLTVT